jgi:hypothetical protein
MSKRYSPSTGGFYETDLHGADIPSDAIYIAPSRYAKLIEQQAAGASIECNPDSGRPVAAWPSVDDRRAALLGAAKREAARRIESVSPLWRQFNDLREQTPQAAVRFAAIDSLRTRSAHLEERILHLAAAEIDSFDVRADHRWTEAD